MSYIESVIERADALVHAVSSSDVVGYDFVKTQLESIILILEGNIRHSDAPTSPFRCLLQRSLSALSSLLSQPSESIILPFSCVLSM